MKKKHTLFTCALLSLAILAGCGTGASSSLAAAASSSSAAASTPAPVTMLVAAAASLEYSFKDKLIPLFQNQYPWVTVAASYDSSGKLQTQIEEGLAADVFMSAAPKQMHALAEGGLIDDASVVNLLENEIVLITATQGASSTVTGFEDIANAQSIALGQPDSVPVGEYAKEALTHLNSWDAIQSKVSFGTNVTEVLNWVAESSAEVGIVYATDAATTDKVKVLASAPAGSLQSKVLYPVGITKAAPQRAAADLFLAFLQTPEALAIFQEYGFTPNL